MTKEFCPGKLSDLHHFLLHDPVNFPRTVMREWFHKSSADCSGFCSAKTITSVVFIHAKQNKKEMSACVMMSLTYVQCTCILKKNIIYRSFRKTRNAKLAFLLRNNQNEKHFESNPFYNILFSGSIACILCRQSQNALWWVQYK